MYRAITLYFLRNNVDWANIKEIQNALENISLEFLPNRHSGNTEIYLNGENVEFIIRDLIIAEKVSEVAALKDVRNFAVAAQQTIGKNKGIVMDGRDIGTTVFPNAEVKIFMVADEAVRVERRYAEMFDKNPNITLDEIKSNIAMRYYIGQYQPYRKEQLDFALKLVKKIGEPV